MVNHIKKNKNHISSFQRAALPSQNGKATWDWELIRFSILVTLELLPKEKVQLFSLSENRSEILRSYVLNVCCNTSDLFTL